MQAIEHQLEWLLAECGYEPDEVMAAARACEHPSPEDFLRKIQDCE
jgi:Mn-dependent DtxR family transcriptional regulator